MRISWFMILGPVLVLTVYAGMNIYAAKSLFQFFRLVFPETNRILFAGIIIFLVLSTILGFFPLPFEIKSVIRFIGSYWMGILIYLFLFFVVADLLLLIASITKILPSPMPADIRFFKGMAVFLLTIGMVFYGVYNANKIISVSYNIQLNKLSLEVEENKIGEIKIVLIADLHLGEVNSERRLESIVRGINDLKPDIVCIVGDIFNDDYSLIRNPDRAIALLKSIESRYGVYAVLGNHDGGNTLNKMINFLQQSNIKLLNDEYIIIDERLVLIGRLDPSPIGGFGDMRRKDMTETIASMDLNMPIVIMDHNPANIGEYGKDVDLILAGHTHRGQIFPGNLFTRAMFVVDYGHYQKNADNPHVIVTQGAGTWMMPMRIGTNNEIVSIILGHSR